MQPATSTTASNKMPGPASFGQTLLRMFQGRPQTASARTVEIFGWIDLTLGLLIFFAPKFMAGLLQLPELSAQTEGYVRLVGLLVSGLGMLYVVSGRLNSSGFVFASLLDRPLVPIVMATLWYLAIVPAGLALAFSITDFGGFLWTLSAWRAERRAGLPEQPPGAEAAAGFFGFVSGVVRNARTFHPDGRVFRGSVRAVPVDSSSLGAAAASLDGLPVLMRLGMGVMKRGMPAWLVKIVPDAPSIAARFGGDFDLLCTAGGNRLWKLVLNLALGGRFFGLNPHDYFGNEYYADVPYRIDNGRMRVWLRLAPDGSSLAGETREEGLTRAVSERRVVRLEAQRAGNRREPFVPFAEIRFEEELEIDQEALHFDPFEGRGFEPYGYLTALRRSVYPASAGARPATNIQRAAREREPFSRRLARYLALDPAIPFGGGSAMSTENRRHSALKIAGVIALVLFLAASAYAAVRFTRDQPVEYKDDRDHFLHGSTGGERTMGIPYWFWIALPELFSEYLPDHKPGRGYQSFGMIYESGADPKYALPMGVSRRNVRGIDVVYLNCAVCHVGTVRDAPGSPQRIIAGMPAHTLDLGAFETFLTTIPLDLKFVPQRMMDQIDAMQSDPHRIADKPDYINRLIFKYYAVYLMREKMLFLRQRLAFIPARTWGPGRVDTFNAPKALLNFPMDKADPRETVGNADFPSIWNQEPREGMQLHWDGNNTSVNERNLSAAFGTGAYPPTLDAPRVLRTARWLMTAKPLPYPYPIDSALAQQGSQIYAEYCQNCHGAREVPFKTNPQQRVGTVDPIGHIKTDRNRLDSYTWQLAANQGTLYAGYEREWGFNKDYPQRFSHFRKTQGYANAPLDGIWLRAPYLHNGSVPNLRELLSPQEKRSKVFYRGNDVYDPQNVGFVASVAEQNGNRYFLFDTTMRGNGNQGHEGEEYGTNLPENKKSALIEYLKTF